MIISQLTDFLILEKCWQFNMINENFFIIMDILLFTQKKNSVKARIQMPHIIELWTFSNYFISSIWNLLCKLNLDWIEDMILP